MKPSTPVIRQERGHIHILHDKLQVGLALRSHFARRDDFPSSLTDDKFLKKKRRFIINRTDCRYIHDGQSKLVDFPAVPLKHPAALPWSDFHREIVQHPAAPFQTHIANCNVEHVRVRVLLLRRNVHLLAKIVEVRVDPLHLNVIHDSATITKQELPERWQLEVATDILDFQGMKAGLRSADGYHTIREELISLKPDRQNLDSPADILPGALLHFAAELRRAKIGHGPRFITHENHAERDNEKRRDTADNLEPEARGWTR